MLHDKSIRDCPNCGAFGDDIRTPQTINRSTYTRRKKFCTACTTRFETFEITRDAYEQVQELKSKITSLESQLAAVNQPKVGETLEFILRSFITDAIREAINERREEARSAVGSESDSGGSEA